MFCQRVEFHGWNKSPTGISSNDFSYAYDYNVNLIRGEPREDVDNCVDEISELLG